MSLDTHGSVIAYREGEEGHNCRLKCYRHAGATEVRLNRKDIAEMFDLLRWGDANQMTTAPACTFPKKNDKHRNEWKHHDGQSF